MLATLVKIGAHVLALDLRRSVRAATVTAVLTLFALAILLVAIGFALSLLTVWLVQVLGTVPALAIIAGGCALLGLMLLAIALLRPGRHRRARPTASDAETARTIEEAIAAVQQGSRESMLAAVVLAVVTGVMLGRKL